MAADCPDAFSLPDQAWTEADEASTETVDAQSMTVEAWIEADEMQGGR